MLPNKIDSALLALLRCAMYSEDISKDSIITALLPEEWDKVFSESMAQGVWSIAFEGAAAIKSIVPQEIASKWFKNVYSTMVLNQKILYAQTSLIRLLEDADINYVILKGTSACVNYPKPEVRVMGDVDFLVSRKDMERATELLLENGYIQLSEEHHCHLEFEKNGITLEMHFEINGIPEGELGDKIRRDMDDMFISNAVMSEYDNTTFRMPSVCANGVVLLFHMEHHILGDGIGLRQMLDWAAYVSNSLTDEIWETELKPYLKNIGMLKFARFMNDICVKYLGMPRRSWMDEADQGVVDELMVGILAGGNFGKRNEIGRFSGRLISSGDEGSSMIREYFKYVSVFAKKKWPKASKYPILMPIAYIYFPIRYIFQTITGKRPSLKAVMDDKQKRETVFDHMAIFEVRNEK